MSDSEVNDDVAVGLVAYGAADDDDDDDDDNDNTEAVAVAEKPARKESKKAAATTSVPAQSKKGGDGDASTSEAAGAVKGLPAALLAKLKKRGIVSAADTGSAAAPTPAEAPLPAGWRIVVEKGTSSRCVACATLRTASHVHAPGTCDAQSLKCQPLNCPCRAFLTY